MARIDPAKLGQWFDEHAAQLVLYARQWRLGCAPEDLVQDVFLRLMAQPAEPGNVKAWLFRAVRNAAISAARTDRRRAGRELRVAEARPGWFQTNPEDLIDAAAAQAALGELPEAQREVVVLRVWGRMTLQDVADTVGMPVSSVHEQYHAGLSALRKKMESSCRTKET